MENKIPKNLVIHCRTEELAKRLMRCLDKLGYTWCSGRCYSPKKSQWGVFKEKTAYFIDHGTYGDVASSSCYEQVMDGETFLERYSPNPENIIYLKRLNKVKLKFIL